MRVQNHESELRAEQLEILRRFPLLIPNNTFTEYKGYFQAGSSDIRLDVKLPHAPSLKEIEMTISSWELSDLLKDHNSEFEQRVETSSFINLLEWIQNLADLHLSRSSPKLGVRSHRPPVAMWRKLVDEVEAIGVDKVHSVDENLSWVVLQAVDLADREHLLRVDLQDSTLHFRLELPDVAVTAVQANDSIVGAYKAFETQLTRLQPFWEVMDEVDSKCWILDPPAPTLSDTRRQIALESGVSLILHIDPLNVLDKPDIKIIGPEASVEPLQELLLNSQWPSEGTSLFAKLEAVLRTSFPCRPEQQNLSQLSQDEMCCVCLMADHLDEKCESCGSVFHLGCLREWLQSVPNNPITFNRISGKCPACQGPISCLV